jgi:protein-S-isoprenylcysteine O-methyltransferase Ste14
MFDGSAESSPPGSARSTNLLLVVAVAAIIVMPFVAGRHPSGAQTVLVLAASAALAAIALAVLAYGGRREAVAQRRSRELPAPDEFTVYRERARR